ncbi:MAG: lamin tail domain-containing protein [Burkholderiales bacterium]|nr:lamin tail domain-containing protein [Bacteroidia bacterium]
MKKTLLSLSLITVALVGKAQNCSELFISEYVEGAGNNKAMEFYNPTVNSINMSNYRLIRYSNGSPNGSDSTDLSGSIASYSTFVIVNGQTSGPATSPACSPILQALAQQLDHAYPAPTYANGDDAMVLARINPYARIDIFGEIGVQPAPAWSDLPPYDGSAGKWWTKDHSLQRKSTVKAGVMTSPSPFIVTLEWDSLPKDNWSKLGSHICDCNLVTGLKSNVKSIHLNIYPNPANGSEIAFVSNTGIKEINIVNAIGQTVYTHTTLVVDSTVVLKNLGIAKGIYYVIIKNELGTKTEKLIIQ